MQPATSSPVFADPTQFPGTGVYPLLDLDTCLKRGVEPLDVLRAWRDAGVVRYYQWRAKNLDSERYLARAREFKQAVPGLSVLANDHVDLVIQAGAGENGFGGLHLGQEDLDALTARQRNGLVGLRRRRPDFILGLSTHNAAQLESALQSDTGAGGTAASGRGVPFWSYLALGPCFPTMSKPTGRDPVLTTAEFERAIERLVAVLAVWKPAQPFPLVLIGGIQSLNIEELLQRIRSVPGHPGIRPVVAGIEWTLDGTQILDMAGKIQTYNS